MLLWILSSHIAHFRYFSIDLLASWYVNAHSIIEQRCHRSPFRLLPQQSSGIGFELLKLILRHEYNVGRSLSFTWNSSLILVDFNICILIHHLQEQCRFWFGDSLLLSTHSNSLSMYLFYFWIWFFKPNSYSTFRAFILRLLLISRMLERRCILDLHCSSIFLSTHRFHIQSITKWS